ncbi:1-deoxy-D-xylulose-5-phosphate reductoisomerase [Catenovulum sediminis]|uniref:1-deoxy-D-xylulose 5-phosphate reductoisomerase n=1 Tax=Catenovulum sediminis TaxID=1740262 RepID=A0ABV1RJA6_9ALTE|nr:1-deoxy-D-xylulose-5-phosphate reductoisomerase [Catenovulum sediminis]
MNSLTILGSTGSIGLSTLEVVRNNPGKLSVFALAANTNVDLMLEQCIEFKPEFALMVDPQAASLLQAKLKPLQLDTEVLTGSDNMCVLASDDKTHTLVAAIVGAAGLSSTLAAAQAGKKILLANKEALVMSGQIFLDQVKAHGAELLPVDSEHNAIYQSLPLDYQQGYLHKNIRDYGVDALILTGSGGPFLKTPLVELTEKTPEQACNHPNWSMGQKISVDSATMMNKGLELIEACWLFGVQPDFIEVLIHPQSVIHSMVRYCDGSILAQLGAPDMKTPIAHCLGFPQRIHSGSAHYDFINGPAFEFTAPDYQRFPNLKLASEAFAYGQEATTVLSAANEVHVAAFLRKQIQFTAIAELNAKILEKYQPSAVSDIDSILQIDQYARVLATEGLS